MEMVASWPLTNIMSIVNGVFVLVGIKQICVHEELRSAFNNLLPITELAALESWVQILPLFLCASPQFLQLVQELSCRVLLYRAAHTRLPYTVFFTWLGKQEAPAKITRSSRSWKNSKVGFAFRVQVKSKVCWIALVAARISFGSWQGPLASKVVAPLSPEQQLLQREASLTKTGQVVSGVSARKIASYLSVITQQRD